jgi:hypothetical protein
MKAHKSECESVADIMQRVSHADLLAHYLCITSLPVCINSPLRKDSHPSFFIYSPDGEKVLYRDYATGDKGDIYSLLKKKDNITFSDLLHKIASEKVFQKKEATFTNTLSQGKKFTKTTRELRVRVRDWQQHDIAYWEQYGISLKWLKYAEVYPISHKIIYKGGQRFVFHAAKYAYVFVERKENLVSLKVYQPEVDDRRRKWDNSNDGSVVGLWTKVFSKGVTSDKVVICSSLKDSLCLWANTGIPAIYVQSETTGLSQTAQDVLRSRFKHIFICFDNDAPGLLDGEELALKTGFKNVVLPYFPEGKDVSDLYKARGKEEFINIVKPLFDI